MFCKKKLKNYIKSNNVNISNVSKNITAEKQVVFVYEQVRRFLSKNWKILIMNITNVIVY